MTAGRSYSHEVANRYGSYACEDCGVEVIRPTRGDRPKLCTDHAIARVADNAYRRAAYGQARRDVRARQRAQSEV